MSQDVRLPGDPRTWDDFRDPAAHGFVKVDCDTTLERIIFTAAATLAVVAAVLYYQAFLIPPSRHLHLSDGQELFAANLLVFGAVVLFAVRMLTDNFYLVDPQQHVVYFHFEFMFVRRVRLSLERTDVAVVTAESRKRRRRYSSWWEQRVVLIGVTGRVLSMSNWRRDGLWEANNTAQDLAKKLSCQWHEAPENCRLVVTMKDGAATVAFEEFTWWTSLGWF